MESTFNFQTTYANAGASWSPRTERLYASEDGHASPLSAEECLFVTRSGGHAHVMTLQVLHALDVCREFRTLDDHIARIEADVPGLRGKQGDIRRVLDGLIRRQLFLGDDVFLARLRKNTTRAVAPMHAVFIRACDRPERLADLVASLTDYEKRHSAGRRYVLVDDSRVATHRDEQRDRLRAFADASRCDVHYIGKTESHKLADTLARAFPHARETARRLLLHDAHAQSPRFGGGRGRNLALLLSAGTRLALLDDDLRLPLRRPVFAESGFDPDPATPACTRFCATMQDALTSGTDIEEDPFELHLRACGHTLGTCIETNSPLRRDRLRGLNLGRLDLLRPDARIVTTHHGSYGSSRSESTLWLYHAIDPAGREEFWRDRESYARNTHAHHIVYGANRARISDVPGFTPFILDNSTLLPCSNPVGRAEDSLAAALTHFCHPESVGFELPVAIGHVQESLRTRFSHTQGAKPPRVNDFLRDFVAQQFAVCRCDDPGERLAFLAHVMRDLAHASAKTRVEQLIEYRRTVHADVVNRLQQQLQNTAAAPVYWQADVRAIVQANAKEMLAASAPRLAEWPADIDATGCAQALTDELEGFADACEHWPDFWGYAAERGASLLQGS